MDRLDVNAISDAISTSATAAEAWQRFSGMLARCGLERTALYSSMPLGADNPFGACERAYGRLWNQDLDRRVREFRGNIRRAEDPVLYGFRPALMYLSRFRAPLFVEHRALMTDRPGTTLAFASGLMVERLGQYQMLVLPLADPATGTGAILAAWGSEDRPDFAHFVATNMTALHLAAHFFLALLEARWPHPAAVPAPPLEAVPHGLSDRERQVLGLLARGAQTGEVADALGLSERTVREYVSRAREKLGARSRAAAIALAVASGEVG